MLEGHYPIFFSHIRSFSMTATTSSAAKLELTPDRAEQLIRLLTDGLVNIVDKTGEFLLKRE